MAMDAALVAAYRGAKMSGVPQGDPMGDAVAQMQASLAAVHDRIQAKKQAQAELDFEKEKAGFVKDEETGEYYKDDEAMLDAQIAAGEKEKKEAEEYQYKKWKKGKGRKFKKDISFEEWKEQKGPVDIQALDLKQIPITGQESSEPLPLPSETLALNTNIESTPIVFKSPFHFNEEDASQEEIEANLIDQQTAIAEVFASKDWKDQKRKELDSLTASSTGLTQPMFEQQQIVINKTKEDNFGDNKWKMIQDASSDPLKVAELVESGALGDEENAAQMLNEYQHHNSLGLTPDTIYKNKQGDARAKITNLASQNETLKQAYSGVAGKLSNYVDYDLDSEFYNKTTAFLNPNNPVELQETGEFVIKSPLTGEDLRANDIDSLVTSNLVDSAGQTKVQQSIDKFSTMGSKDGESPKPKNSLPSDDDLLGSADAMVNSAENFTSWMHDDILGNNSSFAKDIEKHPEFNNISVQLDPTKETPLTFEDKQVVKDALINPKSPFYDEKRSKELMKMYIVERQKQAYIKNNKSIDTKKAAPPQQDVDSILNKYGIDPKLYK
jgi:hypothetical protein